MGVIIFLLRKKKRRERRFKRGKGASLGRRRRGGEDHIRAGKSKYRSGEGKEGDQKRRRKKRVTPLLSKSTFCFFRGEGRGEGVVNDQGGRNCDRGEGTTSCLKRKILRAVTKGVPLISGSERA